MQTTPTNTWSSPTQGKKQSKTYSLQLNVEQIKLNQTQTTSMSISSSPTQGKK